MAEKKEEEKCEPGFRFAVQVLHQSTTAQSEMDAWGSTSSTYTDSPLHSWDERGLSPEENFTKKSVKVNKSVALGKLLDCKPQETKGKGPQLGKKSFRWLEEKILQSFMREQDGPELPAMGAANFTIPPRKKGKNQEQEQDAKKVMSQKLEIILSQIDQEDQIAVLSMSQCVQLVSYSSISIQSVGNCYFLVVNMLIAGKRRCTQ